MGTVCHAARRSVSGMQFHLIRAFDLGANKEEIAEEEIEETEGETMVVEEVGDRV